MTENQNTTLSAKERAALASEREAEAQRRLRQSPAAKEAAPAKRAVPPVTREMPKSGNAKAAPAKREVQRGAATKEIPRAVSKREVPKAISKREVPKGQRKPLPKGAAHENPQKEDTGEFPSYVRSAKRGGYRPPKPKHRIVARQHRRKLDPVFKIILLSALAAALIFAVLLLSGVRYYSTALPGDERVKFFGIAKDGNPQNGWLSYETGISGKLIDGDRIEFSNGDIYEGEMAGLIRSGNGTLSCKVGDVYQGYFANDTFNGNGKMSYRNGDVYEGSFVDGKRQGSGTLRYKNGSVYTGSFEDDLRHGYGEFIGLELVYEGYFVNDIKSGEGKETYKTGDWFEGVFAGDRRLEGTYHFSNGDAFTGSFRDTPANEMNVGKYVYASGRIDQGRYENGSFVE